MSVASRPLTKLMHERLKRAGQEWRDTEDALMAASLLRGEDVKRSSRVQTAAKGKLEARFFKDLATEFDSHSHWGILPEHALTLNFQALAFCLLSRVGAGVYQLIEHVHKQYPYRLFLLLDKPSMSEEI